MMAHKSTPFTRHGVARLSPSSEMTQGADTLAEHVRPRPLTPKTQQASLPVKSSPPSRLPQPVPPHTPQLMGQHASLDGMPGMPPGQVEPGKQRFIRKVWTT